MLSVRGEAMSWKPEVQVVNDDKWYPNGLAFETKEEAEGYAKDLYRRWGATTAWRAAESDEPVTHQWNFERSTTINLKSGFEHKAPDNVQL
jgi:hypothetical protein